MITAIAYFFNHPFFIVVGGLFTIATVTTLLIAFCYWLLGISPLLWRLGLGRWLRDIAILANSDTFANLSADLVASGIFRDKKITHISKTHLAKVKDHSLLLAHYQSFTKNEIKQILNNKKSAAGLIVYFPEFNPSKGKRIPNDMVQLIGSKENTTVVNFRGRLLNDIITTLITTSYEKR
jgi:hypothetical protein